MTVVKKYLDSANKKTKAGMKMRKQNDKIKRKKNGCWREKSYSPSDVFGRQIHHFLIHSPLLISLLEGFLQDTDTETHTVTLSYL